MLVTGEWGSLVGKSGALRIWGSISAVVVQGSAFRWVELGFSNSEATAIDC